jgi:ssDNA-binding Zn-finger/Zn-ribbon topoisomerase 1
MKLRQGKGGNWFLGCSKYPKCRTTAEVSPELLDKIAVAVAQQNMVAPAAAAPF